MRKQAAQQKAGEGVQNPGQALAPGARYLRINRVMTQQELGLNLSMRRTRKAAFLDEMDLVVP